MTLTQMMVEEEEGSEEAEEAEAMPASKKTTLTECGMLLEPSVPRAIGRG